MAEFRYNKDTEKDELSNKRVNTELIQLLVASLKREKDELKKHQFSPKNDDVIAELESVKQQLETIISKELDETFKDTKLKQELSEENPRNITAAEKHSDKLAKRSEKGSEISSDFGGDGKDGSSGTEVGSEEGPKEIKPKRPPLAYQLTKEEDIEYVRNELINIYENPADQNEMLKQKNSELQIEIESLESQRADNNRKLKKQESQLKDLDDENQSLTKQNKDIRKKSEGDLAEFLSNMTAKNEEMRELQTRIVHLQRNEDIRIRELELKLEAQINNNSELNEELRRTKVVLETKRNEIEFIKMENHRREIERNTQMTKYTNTPFFHEQKTQLQNRPHLLPSNIPIQHLTPSRLQYADCHIPTVHTQSTEQCELSSIRGHIQPPINQNEDIKHPSLHPIFPGTSPPQNPRNVTPKYSHPLTTQQSAEFRGIRPQMQPGTRNREIECPKIRKCFSNTQQENERSPMPRHRIQQPRIITHSMSVPGIRDIGLGDDGENKYEERRYSQDCPPNINQQKSPKEKLNPPLTKECCPVTPSGDKTKVTIIWEKETPTLERDITYFDERGEAVSLHWTFVKELFQGDTTFSVGKHSGIIVFPSSGETHHTKPFEVTKDRKMSEITLKILSEKEELELSEQRLNEINRTKIDQNKIDKLEKEKKDLQEYLEQKITDLEKNAKNLKFKLEESDNEKEIMRKEKNNLIKQLEIEKEKEKLEINKLREEVTQKNKCKLNLENALKDMEKELTEKDIKIEQLNIEINRIQQEYIGQDSIRSQCIDNNEIQEIVEVKQKIGVSKVPLNGAEGCNPIMPIQNFTDKSSKIKFRGNDIKVARLKLIQDPTTLINKQVICRVKKNFEIGTLVNIFDVPVKVGMISQMKKYVEIRMSKIPGHSDGDHGYFAHFEEVYVPVI